jgi:hypothetical protein
MVMMAGIVLIGVTCDTFSISRLVEDHALRQRFAESWAFTPALALLLGGALTKSAQWPFHFWLPGAMVAPRRSPPNPRSDDGESRSSCSAASYPCSQAPARFAVLVPVSAATALLGAIQAVRSRSEPSSHATVAALGLITAQYGLGLNAEDALQIFFPRPTRSLFLGRNHQHAAHTRDIRRMEASPAHAIVRRGCAAALSMAGTWPTLGYRERHCSPRAAARQRDTGTALASRGHEHRDQRAAGRGGDSLIARTVLRRRPSNRRSSARPRCCGRRLRCCRRRRSRQGWFRPQPPSSSRHSRRGATRPRARSRGRGLLFDGYDGRRRRAVPGAACDRSRPRQSDHAGMGWLMSAPGRGRGLRRGGKVAPCWYFCATLAFAVALTTYAL